MAAVIIKCNKDKCRFNQSLQCSLSAICIIDRRCNSYQARREEDYQALMQTEKTNCHRDKGKYVSSRITKVFK